MGKWDDRKAEIQRMVDEEKPAFNSPTADGSPRLVGVTYVDEAGRTVTRYPTMYAENAGVQSVTARPRR